MKKILPVIISIFLASECFAGPYLGSRYIERFVPQPRLLEPARDTVDISGQDRLLFRWSSHEQAWGFRMYYDLRLYKGYNMVESTLIFKARVDPSQNTIAISAAMFEDGQVYTWSLRQVYDGYRKSDRSYQSFTVINKPQAKTAGGG